MSGFLFTVNWLRKPLSLTDFVSSNPSNITLINLEACIKIQEKYIDLIQLDK
jgi:hypothetical protein